MTDVIVTAIRIFLALVAIGVLAIVAGLVLYWSELSPGPRHHQHAPHNRPRISHATYHADAVGGFWLRAVEPSRAWSAEGEDIDALLRELTSDGRVQLQLEREIGIRL